MKISVFTLGCKVNQIESHAVAQMLAGMGHEAVEGLCAADLYILNTCAVTKEAERKSRQVLSKAARLSPAAEVVVLGCAGKLDAAAFSARANVSAVLTDNDKVAAVRALMQSKSIESGSENADFEFAPAKTRAFIKVQDGCNHFCSYCIVPYLRGRAVSRPLADCVAEARGIHAKEVVLSGINLSAYKVPEGGLEVLIPAVAEAANARVRLTSLEAGVITRSLLDTLAATRFCPHFHLSLQSGSAGVLKRMNRRYTPSEYAQRVRLIRSVFPSAGITTDVIAGFPEETEDEHSETLAFIQAVGFSDIHVFPYSERPGTPAAACRQVPIEVRRRRAAEIEEAARAMTAAFLGGQCGTAHEVLTEEAVEGFMTGYTENYIRVALPAHVPAGRLVRVRLTQPYKNGAKGELL
ncbi:MAG: MiaB/RimO family radical SAM methylthiotransferase [Clostridiales bacterium]|jgi:threonylcarbamoyladenosine tRNA methylthiotransferase MtaB|nr:MiaB/RimO family radical SAM methylthiotransferase [Clostridiales bacterium]